MSINLTSTNNELESKSDISKRRVRFLLNIVLIIVSFFYIAYTMRAHLDELHELTFQLTPAQLIGLLLMSVVGIVLSSFYHALTIRKLQNTSLRVTQLGLAYAIGQIVRYLPGKVMGVVFEANYLAPFINFSTVAFALLVQTLNSNAWAGLFAVGILAAGTLHNPWPLILLLPASGLLLIAHRNAWSERLLLGLPFARRYAGVAIFARLSSPPYSLLLTMILVLEWLPFLAGWLILLSGQMPASQIAMLGAAYLIASLASTALIIVPSGIVIREAMFVWIGELFGFPLPLLLLCGVVLRIALTFADVLNVVLFWLADTILKNRSEPVVPN